MKDATTNIGKTLKNSIVSVVAQVILLFLQFANRRIFIIFLDIEFLGYQTLFNNIFSLLSVAELGIGNIICYQLYKEVVNDNKEEIGRLMYLYKWLYRVVAMIVFIGGMVSAFFLPYIVTDSKAGWSYLYLIYFMQLTSIIFGYFLSYMRTIYTVTQQEYKCVKVDLYVSIVIQILQIALLAIFRNFIIYFSLQLSTTIIANIIIAYRTKREYPFVVKKYDISKKYLYDRNLFSDIKNFLMHRISYAVWGGTDNIIISMFCGVRKVALYGNYALIQSGVMSIFFNKLLNPVQATIGNIVYSERKKEDLWEQFKVLDVFSFFFASYIGISFWIFYQPVIQLWMGKEYLLSDIFVALYSITIYLYAVFEIVYKYRTVFGDYKNDRNFMILSAFLNVVISVIGAKNWGISGIQVGTLISFLLIAYGRIRFVVSRYFEQSCWKYIFKHLLLLILFIIESILCYILCNKMPISIMGVFERGIIIILVPMILNVSIYFRNQYFRQMLKYFKRMINIIISYRIR